MFEGLFQPIHLAVLFVFLVGIYGLVRLIGAGWWVGLLGFGLLVSPLLIALDLYGDLQVLTGPFHASVPQEINDLLGLELLVFVLLLAGTVYLNILFFRKKKTFPKRMIILLLAACALNLLVYWMVPEGVSGDFTDKAAAGLVGTFLMGFIWIPYLLSSQRVKATFVR